MYWAAIMLLAATATGGDEACDLGIEAAPAEVRRLMQDREFAQTVQAVNAALELEGAPVEYLGYLRG
ncbi:MAG: hypothetical protein KDA61_03595, partial [Planctomycetales bacterium]|nr:hypothetical protein [Planctomycetales bacterium]